MNWRKKRKNMGSIQMIRIFELMMGCLTSISSTSPSEFAQLFPHVFSMKQNPPRRVSSIFQAETRLQDAGVQVSDECFNASIQIRWFV